jgi:hypothetical protein
MPVKEFFIVVRQIFRHFSAREFSRGNIWAQFIVEMTAALASVTASGFESVVK